MNPASNPPTIATGTQLTAEPQVSGGLAPYTNTFQWKRDGNNITDATTSVYTVATADVGAVLTCTVNSADSADPQNTASGTSNPTGTVEADAPDTPTLESPVSGQRRWQQLHHAGQCFFSFFNADAEVHHIPSFRSC